MVNQNPDQKKWIERVTDPFSSLGISASNYESLVTLKTSEPSENSLYTILKITEKNKATAPTYH